MTSPSSGGAERPASSRRRLRRYATYVVGALAMFGVLGALGTRTVDALFASADGLGGSGPAIQFDLREPQSGSDGFSVAARTHAGLEPRLQGADSCKALFTAARNAGAVDVGESALNVLLEGRTDRSVTIVGMRAKPVRKQPPLRGALVNCSVEGGGTPPVRAQSSGIVQARTFVFDLDESEAAAATTSGSSYFESGDAIELTEEEVESIHVVAQTGRAYVEWRIEADVVIDGKRSTLTIDNAGKPFRLTGWRPSREYARRYQFVEEDRRLQSSQDE